MNNIQKASEGTQAEVGDLIAIVVERDFDISSLVVPTSLKGGKATEVPSESTPHPSPATTAPSSASIDQTPPSG